MVMAKSDDDTADKVLAFVVSVAALFYKPLVITDGWAWHATGFGLPEVQYWTVMALVVLHGVAFGNVRAAYSRVTVTDGEIATTTLIGLALSHWIMWVVQ
jgi:hypothetical protein